MQIQAHIHPELEVVSAVRALENACKVSDKLAGTLFLDPSLNANPDIPCLLTLAEGGELVALLTMFTPSLAETELVGLTHPLHRRNGYFRALVRAAAELARSFSVPDLLFSCERFSESGVAAVKTLGAALDFTEYRLRFSRPRTIAGRSFAAAFGRTRGTRTTSAKFSCGGAYFSFCCLFSRGSGRLALAR